MHKFQRAFTIVELLVVIVIIGILATVVITAFNGISGRAKSSALSSDLAQAKKQIETFYAVNGVYPTANNCTNTAATEICLKTSPGNTLTYTFNSNTATPPYTLTGAITGVVAKYSAYFDGNGDYLSLPSNAAFGPGTGAYTIEAWIYPLSWASNYVPIFRNSGTNGLSFSKGYNANTLIVNNIGVGDMITSASLPSINAWSHVVAVRSGTTLSIFVNGVRTATASNSVNHPTSDAYVGGPTDAVNSYFNGYISNLRFVKGTAVYDPTQTTLTVPTTPLTAISGTSLLTANASSLVDGSSNNFTITKYGDTAVSTQSPF